MASLRIGLCKKVEVEQKLLAAVGGEIARKTIMMRLREVEITVGASLGGRPAADTSSGSVVDVVAGWG